MNKFKKLTDWFDIGNNYQPYQPKANESNIDVPKSHFTKSQSHPGVLFHSRSGEIFFKYGVVKDEFTDIQSVLQDVYDSFEYGTYHVSEIINYIRNKKIENLGI